MKTLRLFVFVALVLTPAFAQEPITAAEARNHVGENATVCGGVASTHYAARSRGNPTFINLDRPYPAEIFTLLIWDTDRAKFGNPEERYRNARICVTGQISEYRGVPQIVAHSPSQIKVRQR